MPTWPNLKEKPLFVAVWLTAALIEFIQVKLAKRK